MQKYKTELFLIIILLFFWEAEFFILDIWPHFKAQAAEPPQKPQVVINEIAWMGTEASTYDEWIELFNNSNGDINLNGWTLKAADTTPNIGLSGTIPTQGYFILERNSDNTIPGVPADLIYGNKGAAWALHNEGEKLELWDSQGNLIDQTPEPTSSEWPTGRKETKQTMERKNPLLPGDDSLNWQTSAYPGGTPKAPNSQGGEEEPNPEPPSDTTPPNEATNLQSPTHTPSSWSSNNTIKVTWTDAIDNEGGSGLDGYAVLWDTSPDTLPLTNKNLEEGIETNTSSALSDGNNHYFHIRAVDKAGNWDDVAVHLGPFYIDTQGPATPSLLSPSNQTTTSDVSPTFSWNISTDGEGGGVKSYRIYIDDESTFSPPRVKEYTTSSLNYTPNLYGGYFYWKVYAKDNVGNISNWSNIWELRIEPGSSNSGFPTYPRHIWINEFLPNPEGKDTENEFIELYNKGPNEIDLESWQVDDKEDGGSRPYTFPENSKIGAGEYLTLPYSQTKIALNNDEDWVRLLWPEGEAIDELQYESPPPGKSFNKHFPNWCWSDTPTPSEQNICSEKETEEEAQNYPRSLWINEFLPDPKGKDTEGEFIELQNRGDEEIELAGWQLDDREDGGSRPYTFPKNPKIAPGSYLVIYYQDSKIALNNDGDWVRLLNPNGEAIDEIQYPKASEGKSYSRQNISSWQWTENPTPGKDNEFPQILAAAAPKSTSPSPLLPQTGPNLQFYLFSLLFFILPIFFFPKRLID